MFARRDAAAQERIHSNPTRVGVVGTRRQCVCVRERVSGERNITGDRFCSKPVEGMLSFQGGQFSSLSRQEGNEMMPEEGSE